MRATYLWAIAIAVLLVSWLASGQFGQEAVAYEPSIAERNAESLTLMSDQAPTQVRVVLSQAQMQIRYANVRGKTQNKRTVDVKTEIKGRVVTRAVERGQAVAANQLLCGLSIEDRKVALIESQQRVKQARIDFDGAKRLRAQGYNSESAIAAARTQLAAAQAELARRDLALEKTSVRAPFAGFVEDVHLEIGDYVQAGQPCATLVDMNPMLMVGRVSERVVQQIDTGIEAIGSFGDSTEVRGPISFVGQQDDPRTRTYAIEVELDNANGALRSGLTAQIRIPVAQALAQKVSPALFSLDDSGGYGIRVVNDDDRVEFYTVDIIAEEDDGVWVTGLPNRTKIITVGQELVVSGERVDPVLVNTSLATSSASSLMQAGS